jgi:hypothetical protein
MDRIDALIKQATHDCMGVDILDKRELAELIIQECGVALNLPLRDMISRGQAYRLIQQHFGINTDR